MKNRCSFQITAFTLILACEIVNADPLIASAKTKSDAQSSSKDFYRKQSAAVPKNSIGMEDVHGTVGGKIPAHHELSPGSRGFFFTTEFLYWQANEDNLELGTEIGEIADPLEDSGLIRRTVKDLHFKWNPGFRVGIGGQLKNHDDWDLFLNYTFMRNEAHRSITFGFANDPAGATGSVFIPAWNQVLSGGLKAGSGHNEANWSVNYNTLDFEIGRDYFAGKNLTLHPHVGLRGATLFQDYHLAYQLVFPATISKTKMDAHCNFWGVGIRAGTDMMWHFNGHWGIYGMLSGALLYGHFDVVEKTQGAGPADPNVAKAIFGKTVEDFWRIRTTLQAGLGLEWETLCNHDKCRVALSLGYEFNEWFNQNQFLSDGTLPLRDNIIFSETRKGGDLGFQGGVFKMRFDF